MYYWFHQSFYMAKALPFIGGWLADRLLGDPEGWPHPVVGFGKVISLGEKTLNKGNDRAVKGGVMALILVVGTYLLCERILMLAGYFHPMVASILVGIRAAALETLAENLSDGVIAPMFWFALLGLPGMMAYKMVNTLDSMIGYKNERYLEFGQIAARLDDLANYIPARLTAWLMLAVSGNLNKMDFVKRFGPAHASPNSGYPESALAAILNCRFGGTHDYFGKPVEKPYIGTNERTFTTEDMLIAIKTNSNAELTMGLIVCLISIIIH